MGMLKGLALAGALSVLLAGNAQAADVAPLPETFDWSGFYVGANVGYAFSDGYDITGKAPNGDTTTFRELNLEGINGGVQAGYNFQLDRIVLGAEADVQAADIDDDFGEVDGSYPGTTGGAKQKVDFFGTARARLGFAFDNLLIYATGGYAWGNVKYKANLDNGPTDTFWNEEAIEDGYTVGGGLEYGVSDNMSIKAEYLYIDLGSDERVRDSASGPGSPDWEEKIETNVHLVRAGLNWRF